MEEQTNPDLDPEERVEPAAEPSNPEDGNEGPANASQHADGPAEGEAAPEPQEPESEARDAADIALAGGFDIGHVKRVLEAALLSSPEPLGLPALRRLFSGQVDAESLRKLLAEIREEWSERAVELTAVASGWRFRVKPQYQEHLDRITNEKPPRYSRAVLETLAIIAYRQPVTRGDIEEIRGVAVSPPTLKALEERGWIEVVGHRETPGRPALFATTRKFLDDLNLRSLEELPPLDELQAALDPAQPGLEAAARQVSLIDAAEAAEGPTAEAAEEASSPSVGGGQGNDAEAGEEPASESAGDVTAEAAEETSSPSADDGQGNDAEGSDVQRDDAPPAPSDVETETETPRDEETPSGAPVEPEEPDTHAG